MSWEVWAALSELIVCGTVQTTSGRGLDQRTVPAVTSASVWQRAEELRCADSTKTACPASSVGMHRLTTTAITTGCRNHDQHRQHVGQSSAELHTRRSNNRSNTLGKAVDGSIDSGTVHEELTRRAGRIHHREGNNTQRGGFTGPYSTGDLGAFSRAGFGSCGSGGGGYGDRSFSEDESPSTEETSPEEHDVCVGNNRSSSNKGVGKNSRAVRARRNSGPQTDGNASRRRLRQTLAMSRRRWFSKSCRQRNSGRKGIEKRSPSPGRRPETAPAAPVAARAGMKGRRTLTPPPRLTRARAVSVQQVLYQTAPETELTYGVGGGTRPDQCNRRPCDHQTWIGAWEAGAVAGEGGSEIELRGEGTRREATAHQAVMDELEKGRFRTETASAKRKASKYQTCMRETQVNVVRSLTFLGAQPIYRY